MDEFVSEPIEPEPGSFDAAGMSRGEPGLPRRFVWREHAYHIQGIQRQWKTSAREGGIGELYLRRHWYEVLTTDGQRMTLYCERQPKPGKTARQRWWIYSVARLEARQE